MLKLTIEQQARVIDHIRETFTNYEDSMASYRERMERIYKGVSSFLGVRNERRPRETTFKVNKAHEIENKVLPRIISRDPKWLVSYKASDMLEEWKDVSVMADAIRDYLSEVFKKQDMRETLRLWAKNMVRYGNGWVKVGYKYDISRTQEKAKVIETDEFGNQIESVQKQIQEKISGEYPTIEAKSWTDVFYDPRYLRFEDMPSIIEVARNVRLSFFSKNKSKYMNLWELVALATYNEDMEGYKQRVYQLTWLNVTTQSRIRPDKLEIKCYYWLFDLSNNDDLSGERLYEFWTVNDTVLVYADEISSIPFEDIRCFEDTETYFSTWFVEPILGLQDEMNYKKNQASNYINLQLNDQWIWSVNSWIDPRKLSSAPWQIIPTTKDWPTAQANLIQIKKNALPYEYFQEQNDFERQIQASTFTIDTAQPLSQQSLTNTATGAKIKAFENNSVMDETRKHFEEWVARLAYKLLQFTFENMENNLMIKKSDGTWFREVNKEAMRDAIERYSIVVEAGSSSFDSEETRRESAIAQWNLSTQATQAGVPVDLKYLYEEMMSTFEWVDKKKLFKSEVPQLPQQGGGWPIPMPQQKPEQLPQLL